MLLHPLLQWFSAHTLSYNNKYIKLFFYILKGYCAPCVFMYFSLQAADLSKPIDKRIYKGTQPTCHDFNHLTATAESVSLLVGFSAGQVQLIDPIKKETSKLFNEEVGPRMTEVRSLRVLCSLDSRYWSVEEQF